MRRGATLLAALTLAVLSPAIFASAVPLAPAPMSPTVTTLGFSLSPSPPVGAVYALARGGRIVRARIAEHFACSNPADSRKRCYFSTPSDNVHCVWTPRPNRVTCELLSTRRAYRLSPSGPAKGVRVTLTRRGETLPVNQMVVFPDELSCQDTKVAMTCYQDEGSGEFKLPQRAHFG